MFLCNFFLFKLYLYRIGLKKNVKWLLSRFFFYFYVKLMVFNLLFLNVCEFVINWMKINLMVVFFKMVFKMFCVIKFKFFLRGFFFRINLIVYLILSLIYKKK